MRKVTLSVPDDLYQEIQDLRRKMTDADIGINMSRIFRRAIRPELARLKGLVEQDNEKREPESQVEGSCQEG